jgi:hypothetical protein
MTESKLRRTDNSLSTTWPKQLLSCLDVKQGYPLFLIETRYVVTMTLP